MLLLLFVFHPYLPLYSLFFLPCLSALQGAYNAYELLMSLILLY